MDAEHERIKEHVKEHYIKVAELSQRGADPSRCAESCCGPDKISYASSIGYSKEELADLPESVVNACAGCGNPSALAGLREGEVVLDLGSGGGIDVFLAARRVGPTGKAMGVDMTEEMVELARRNAARMGLENVEFRLGDIEALPVEDESVDVIISNCVINLAPDKDRVFREAYRVLKPGGRMLISDVVTKGEIPQAVRDDPDAWAGCVAGALDEAVYLEKIRNAGFRDIRVLSRGSFTDLVYSAKIEAHKPLD